MPPFPRFATGLLALCWCVSAAAQAVHKELRIAPGKRLEVDLQTGGSLRITGWDRKLIRLDGELAGRDAGSCEVRLEALADAARLVAAPSERTSSLQTHCTFELKVPRSFNLAIQSAGGPVTVDDVEGTVDVQTLGGPVRVARMRGLYALATNGGDIQVEAVDGRLKAATGSGVISVWLTRAAEPRRELTLATQGGDVRLFLPRGVHGDLKVDLDGDPRHVLVDGITGEAGEDAEKAGEGPTLTVLRVNAQGGSVRVARGTYAAAT